MLGVPPNTLPLVIYIGIFCYWVLVHYNISFKTIAGGFNGAFWWYGPLSVDREIFKQIYQNYLVALTGGNSQDWRSASVINVKTQENTFLSSIHSLRNNDDIIQHLISLFRDLIGPSRITCRKQNSEAQRYLFSHLPIYLVLICPFFIYLFFTYHARVAHSWRNNHIWSIEYGALTTTHFIYKTGTEYKDMH